MDSGWQDATPFIKAVIDMAPDRMIWGTDWPHVQYRKPMPTDTELLELLYRATPEPCVRQKVLCQNPETLFGFSEHWGVETGKVITDGSPLVS
jgi:2-pyrone-4,6-dicarboxylate lactonase